MFSNLFGRGSNRQAVIESDVGVNPVESGEFTQSTVSYILKPILYTAKCGAKVLSTTTVVVSYALSGTSYVVAGASYIPYGASRVLEECKGKDENTVGYKITTSSQHLLNFTSGVIYAVSYVPYGAAMVLKGVSDVTGSVDSYLSTEKIEQICTKSDLLVDNLKDNLSSVLKGIETENFSQALAIVSRV